MQTHSLASTHTAPGNPIRSRIAPRHMNVKCSASVRATAVQRSSSSSCAARATQAPGRRSLVVRAIFGSAPTKGSFYDFEVKNIDGKPVKLEAYKGKVVLVVNLASQCGFTPQYAELEELYEKYSKQGLVVAGFPCNQFGGQEPGFDSEIKRFATSKFKVTFPLFSKVNVNGPDADPVFDYLKSQKGGLLNNDIKWNFSKFLVDKTGKVVGRYPSTTTPKQLEADIAKLL